MKFTVGKKTFSDAIEIARDFCSHKETIPILRDVLIEAGGNGLRLTATDLDAGVRLRCPAEIKEPGRVAILADRLLAHIEPLMCDEVVISSTDNGAITLKTKSTTARIPTHDCDGFPELPEHAENGIELNRADFVLLLSRATLATEQNEDFRTYRSTVHLETKPSMLRAVATQGHRLSLCEMAATLDHARSPIQIDAAGVTKLVKFLRRSSLETIAIDWDENHFFLNCGEQSALARQVIASFPDYARALPRNHKGHAKFPAKNLQQAISSVRVFLADRTQGIVLGVKAGEVSVSCSSEQGDATNTVEAECDGELNGAFNHRYISDFLALVDETTTLKFNSATEPLEFGMEDGSFRYFVQGMRL